MAAPKKGRSAERPEQAGARAGPDPDRHRGAHRGDVPLRAHHSASGHRPRRRHEHHAQGEEPAGQAQRDQQDQHGHRGRASSNRRVNGLGVSEAEVQTQGDRQHHRQHPQGHELEAGPRAGRHHRQALLPPGADHRGHRRRRQRSPSTAPSASGSQRPLRGQGRRADKATRPSTLDVHVPVGHRHHPGPRGHRRPEGRRRRRRPPSASASASAAALRERQRLGPGDREAARPQYAALDCTKPRRDRADGR